MIAEVYSGFPMPLSVAVIVPIAFLVWWFFLRGKDSREDTTTVREGYSRTAKLKRLRRVYACGASINRQHRQVNARRWYRTVSEPPDTPQGVLSIKGCDFAETEKELPNAADSRCARETHPRPHGRHASGKSGIGGTIPRDTGNILGEDKARWAVVGFLKFADGSNHCAGS